MLTDLNGQGIKMVWVEIGDNTECERALGIKNDRPNLIVFRHGQTRYEHFKNKFTVEKVKEFILKVKATGLQDSEALPDGGIKLVGI